MASAHSSWPPLYGTPVIQKRVSIARPPAPPIEDSNVLVLNSRSTLSDPSAVGAEVLYLDLRLSLPATGSVRVNWAFAGLRKTVPLDKAEGNALRYHWKHTIDSHGRDQPPDEGTMVQHKDSGGEVMEVETGMGIDPKTGKMGPYEEVWKSENIPSGTPFVFLASDKDPDQAARFMAVVGPHAIGLWQEELGEGLYGDAFHAVRLRIDIDEWRRGEGKHLVCRKVFTSGHRTLDGQLEELVEEVLTRGREGKCWWRRGEMLVLKDNQGRKLPWTVWDVGQC